MARSRSTTKVSGKPVYGKASGRFGRPSGSPRPGPKPSSSVGRSSAGQGVVNRSTSGKATSTTTLAAAINVMRSV